MNTYDSITLTRKLANTFMWDFFGVHPELSNGTWEDPLNMKDDNGPWDILAPMQITQDVTQLSRP